VEEARVRDSAVGIRRYLLHLPRYCRRWRRHMKVDAWPAAEAVA
jgi:hypothetical protein